MGQGISKATLPEAYSDFKDVFDKKKADVLPPHRHYDCPIDIPPNKAPPYGPIYSLNPQELKVLREYIDENLAKGFIDHSTSPAGAPVLFSSKKDGGLRLCVDYRGLNAMTAKNRYAIPLIPSLLDRLTSAKIYTKIDLRNAYNLIRIREGDQWKTAFRTCYGHFQYNVMPMGLTNAPAVFQHMINDVLRDYLDIFVVAYLDDLLIFSANPIEHEQHVKKVLTCLREAGLFAKLEKCHFHSTEVEFLGYMVTPQGIFMDPTKIRAITAWEPPHTLHAVQSFLGFANFYRRFIKGFSRVVLPLTALTRKTGKSPFLWGTAAQEAFESLKKAFTTAPILRHADPTLPFVLETDASDFALGAVLSQSGDDGLLHPVAYHSRKFTAAEINYEIYDKELLAIVDSFEVWRHFLEGAQHPITVFTDHKNLLYFTTSRVLNRRQARWSISLSRFDFQLHYRPGPLQGKPDALSRQAAFAPKIGDAAYDQQRTILLKPDYFHGLAASSSLSLCSAKMSPMDDPLLPVVREGLVNDTWASKMMARLHNTIPVS